MQGIKLKYNIPHSIIMVQNHGFNIRKHFKYIEATKKNIPNTQECQHQGSMPGYKNKNLGTYILKQWLR